MREPESTTHSPLPALDAADRVEVEKFDELIQEARQSNQASRTTSKELRVLMWLNVLFFIPIFTCYIWLPRGQAAVIALYITIVATVIAGFGIYRAMRGTDKSRPRAPGIAGFGVLLFTIMFAIYCTILVTLTHRLDPNIETLQSTTWQSKTQDPLRKK